MSWFKRTRPQPKIQSKVPNYPVEYPAGIALRTEKGFYFLHKDGKRYRITSDRIVDSWHFPFVVETSEIALSRYPVAVGKLGFRDGSLLNNIADGRMYIVSESKLRHITSPDVLERLGVTRDDALLVSDADINIMKLGEEII